MKSSSLSAILTTSLKLETTSGTGVEIIGVAVAMYSRALVGLMYSVASFIAKGIRQTSKALVYAGRSEYSRPPNQCRFARCGNEFGSILQTGPTMHTFHCGFA